MASENVEELLFFDTFSHDSSEEINLDLVQFPKPVLISEIRIIPLGARVQADFPGGVRLGATNPSQFHIEFFVNDLSKPGASTFESLGGLEYRQNVDIQLECKQSIPTDGLVLRGWYTTITLAVYGILSKGIPPPVPPVPVPDRRSGDISTSAATAEWVQQHAQVADRPQENLYLDQGYNYPPEYQPNSQEHPYVEGWPGPNVPPPTVPLAHNDAYVQPAKEYEAQPTWEPVREPKSWEHSKENELKPDHSASPSRSLAGESQRDWQEKREDDKEKPRSRDERDKYWDESSDIRDDRERSKTRDDRRDKELDDRGRDRRSDKDREWRRRDDDRSDDRDRYRDRDKDRKEREGSAKDECSRDRGNRDERSRMKDRERDRNSLRDERTSSGNSRSRRSDRDRSLDRGSWHERNVDSTDGRSRSKNYRENSWEKDDRRDRERSPCSDASGYRRRPRSPPSRSPKRPYTPTERFWSPEQREAEYNSPNSRPIPAEVHEEPRKRSPGLSPSKNKVTENLKIDTAVLSPQTPLLSPAKYSRTPARSQSPTYGHSPLAQDEPSLDDEQFEPILSDEDIIDESDSQYQDIDYDFPDDMEEVVKPFNPFNFQVQPSEYFLDPSFTPCEKEKFYSLRFKTKNKFTELNQIREIISSHQIEDKTNIKEDWVQAVESLLPLLEKGLARITPDDPIIPALISWVGIGLNLDLALVHSQPGYKVRHVKSGIRLTESLCWCGSFFAEELVTKEMVQQKLLELFHKEYMALSIKLMILKALDSTLIDEKSINYFLNQKFLLENDEALTGYQHLFKMLEGKQLVRVKFGLTSLIKKIHIYELLENLKRAIEESIKDGEYESDVGMYLREIEKVYADADMLISQPKRFLPVQSQFEINISSPNTYVFLYKYFKTHKLLEIFLVLLSNKKTNVEITTTVQNLIKQISERQDGLLFLSSNPEVTNNLLKILSCQTSEDYIDVIPGTTVYLGVEITCRLQALQILDKLFYCNGNEELIFELVHELYCVSFTPIGKIQVAFVLSLNDNIQILLNVLERDKKTAIRDYLYDLLILTVKYSDDVSFLKKYGKVLLELAEEDKTSHLCDISQWLKPLESENIITYDDVSPLCDILKKYTNLDNCAALPGDLITCVRILKYLGIPKNENDLSVQCYDEEYTELKYKYVILQLYSLDALSYLNNILVKILEYYEQPFVHSINLLTPQGTNLLSFIEPCIMLMRRMLTYVISVRNNEYKDLTHVNTLIEVFTLMQAVPPNAECYLNAQKVCRDIVETLLAYTQPIAAQNASESETFTKSLWTLMISEVLKYITKSSFTFIPGFLLLSELLPLPIPIPSRHELDKTEINQIINSRKLWSAHLHTLSPIIHDLIATMAGSSYAPLLQLVRRVCLQLADLAAPTALVISKSVLDPLLSTLQKPPTQNQQGGPTWEIPCTSHALRLLNFLACLISHASIKAAVLSLLTVNNNKQDERFLGLVNGFTAILRTPCNIVTHTQVQEHVILIIQALFDTDLTLVPVSSIQPGGEVSVNDVFLANALPARDLLGTLVTALLDHIATPENSFLTILSVLKTFLLLTEHDYGFFHLKNCIDMKNEAIWSLLIKICNGISRENNECLTVLCSALELFRELVTLGEEVEVTGLSPRTISMTVPELAAILKWGWTENEKPHPILHLESLLKEWSANDESFVSLCENLEDFVKLLNTEGTDKALPPENKAETIEPLLPPVMPLMSQFSSRPVYVIGESDDKRLSSVYWLSPPTCDDSDQEMDQITCDLMELASSFLPDLHLPHEVERICMLKSTDDEEDPKKPQISKYHFSGTRTRRPFITPMRGRGIGRAAPQRGDLFRSRPPNTSRPPSLHVDDFVALETCGQQPTGPTGYNKISMRAVKDILATRTRGRGRAYVPERGRFFGAPTYPRRDSPRGVLRGRGSWLQHEDVGSSRPFHLAERLPLRAESAIGRFLGRGRAVSSWNTRSEQFGGMPIRGIRKEPARHSRTFSR